MLRAKMLEPMNVLLGCSAYLREHPREVLRAARQATRLRFGVPIVALRWLALQLEALGGPQDIELDAVPPGIRVTATIEEMGTLLRGSAILIVEDTCVSADELKIVVRLSDVSIRLLDERANTPLAALVRSGALDLSRLANLIAHLPTRPAVLVEAVENRLVLDLMHLPLLSRDKRLRRLVGTVSTLLSVKSVETDATHLDVALTALPCGLAAIIHSK